MTLLRLVTRGLSFYWRTHLAVGAAVAVACAVLTGALAIGDSVRGTLQQRLNERLGQVQWALAGGDRYFRMELAEDLARDLGRPVVPVIQLRAVVSNQDGTRRANAVGVLGVDERFFQVGPRTGPAVTAGLARDEVWVNRALARRLAVAAGDTVVLRIDRPETLSGDMPLAPDSGRTLAARLTVRVILDPGQFGDFQMAATSATALNAFVPLQWLQGQIDRPGRANGLLAAGEVAGPQLQQALHKGWRLSDAELELRTIASQSMFELRTSRVFLDRPFAQAAETTGDQPTGVLAYFVNTVQVRDKVTPYSMVAAVSESGPYRDRFGPQPSDDSIVINQWLADDLGAGVGDEVDLTYYVVGTARGLTEKTSRFRVSRIIPMEGLVVDPNLMPEYPGLATARSCRDWDPGIAIDLKRIRPKDEDYWDRFRGTPKAFVTLAAGRALWASRYGDLTAVRWPMQGNTEAGIATAILGKVDPGAIGLSFQPVRQQGGKAAAEGTDFGPLFLGLSMFLIGAAVVLIGLLFVFSVEGRSEQIGTLLALGFGPGSVRRLFLLEGGLVALIGVLVGTVIGLAYTRALIAGLSTIWRGAAGGSPIFFYVRPSTLVIGAGIGMVTALAVMAVTLQRQVRYTAHQLLSGGVAVARAGRPGTKGMVIGLVVSVAAVLGAIAMVVGFAKGNSSQVAGAFFGAGALLLAGGLVLLGTLLRAVGLSGHRSGLTRAGLAIRNAARRPGRSQAVIAILACGVFMVVAVGANRQGLQVDPADRRSGTGGFALYAETTVPILQDLNTDAGRKAMGLDTQDLAGTTLVQARVYEGDDASCLNLNRAQRPRLLGVDPARLKDRFSFRQRHDAGDTTQDTGRTIQDSGLRTQDAWSLLERGLGPDVVPAIGDYTTVFWGLGKTLGDMIEYADEAGRRFAVRIVGIIDNSVLQGSLVISEQAFVERFPSKPGYGVFLVDVPAGRADQVSSYLSTRLADFGMAAVPTSNRLAMFGQVENTYLSVFLILGGLGLVVGTVGLGLVVLRNLLERRGELAMMRAVGFDRGLIVRIVFAEHWGLLAAGLVWGVGSAIMAIGPAIKTSSGQLPISGVAVTIVALAVSGAAWVALAAMMAIRGSILDGLRNE